MAEREYAPPDGFLTMAQAQERLGVSKRTLQLIVERRRLKVYKDDRDSRYRLLRVEDVEALTIPKPVE